MLIFYGVCKLGYFDEFYVLFCVGNDLFGFFVNGDFVVVLEGMFVKCKKYIIFEYEYVCWRVMVCNDDIDN